MNIPSITLDDFFADHYCDSAEAAPMWLLSEAEIILGQDVVTQQVFVVDGKQTLSEVVKDAAHDPVNVVLVELDRATDDLRQLRQLIEIAKCR